jgi:hypothetical protein
MRIARRLSRRAWLAFTISALVALAVLLAFGLRGLTVRQYALGSPNQEQVALLQAGDRVCEGPIALPAPVQGAGIWGGPTGGLSRTIVSLQDARTQTTLTAGRISATRTGEYRVLFDKTIHAGRSVRVCLRETAGTFSLLGSTPANPAIVMSGGAPPGNEFSLVLLRRSGQTLLGSLPTAFARASLWRPSWVGSWTFWVLCGALLATIVLGSVAISSAARDDDRQARAQATAAE